MFDRFGRRTNRTTNHTKPILATKKHCAEGHYEAKLRLATHRIEYQRRKLP